MKAEGSNPTENEVFGDVSFMELVSTFGGGSGTASIIQLNELQNAEVEK